MISFFGHFHPLLVHLPIGILLLAYVLECMARWFGQEQLRPAIKWAVFIGLGAATLSALTGWLLAETGDYDAFLLQRHRWLGIGTALIFATVWFTSHHRFWYFPMFTVGILALCAAGHYGGSLTHGADFLLPKAASTAVVLTASTPDIGSETPIFKGIIQPILKEKCVTCHRPEKKKGDLDLSTEEGILAGGKHGKILGFTPLDSTVILRRLQLPLTHKAHMPPSGKSQLSALEIQLLEWWIASGVDFQSLLKDNPLPSALGQALLESRGAPTNPVFSLSVPAATALALERLAAMNMKVATTGQGQPWLSVSLAGQTVLTPKHWEALDAVSVQLVDLDLAHTAVSDQDLSSRNFPHLVHLNLAQTKVSNGMLSFIQKAPYLESINLTNTLVDNTLQDILPKLPQLKKLYLWQSKTTPDALEAWRKLYPNLTIEAGAEMPDSAPLTLRSPKLLYSRSFFDDTVQVELSFPFKGVDIYYTIAEAASPTTQSPKYKEKIVLDNTAHVRAFAAKAGWNNSPLTEAVFVRKKIAIASATLKKLPSPKYPAKGAASLIDGKIADAQGADTWLGFEGEHLDATLDLGQSREIGQVFVHCLENNSPWIFKPLSIQVSTSVDGKKYTPQATERFPANISMGEQKVHLLGCHFKTKVSARYLQVRVESPLKNPPWHPGKGQKCWIFVDELTVE